MNVTLTLFGQMGTFLVLVLFVWKVLWDPMVKMLEERKTKIADGLAAAERGLKERELAEQRAKEVLHEARDQAKEIIAQAQRRADEIVEESKGDARVEGERIISAARAEIEQERNRARDQLRGEVVRIALEGAEQVLMREVDSKIHTETLEKLAARL